jgi:hypothetical protein
VSSDQNKPQTLRDIIKGEYKKCFDDPAYFCKKYVKITHQTRGTIAFDLFGFQQDVLKSFHANKFNIILKSRQMGISTLVAVHSLWLMLFHENKNILIISLTQDTAKEVVTKATFAWKHLPSWLKMQAIEENKLSLKLKNGSSIKASSTTGKSGVSFSNALLCIDEAALIEDANLLWSSAQPSLSTGGDCIIMSTPRGVGSWFHKMWIGAEEKKNGFVPIKLHWSLHPERDEKWREIEGTKMSSPKEAAREYDCDFMTSGNTVVDLPIIQWYKETMKRDPVECRGIDKSLWIWEYPDYNRNYTVAADVSRGDGGDFSAFHVLDVETLNQCAEYKGQIDLVSFGHMLVNIATEYNKALLIVENTGVGFGTIQTIVDTHYPNTFYSTVDLKYVELQKQMITKYYSEEKKMVPGFSTTLRTRPLIISRLEQYFRDKAVNIYSIRMLGELETFIWDKGKAQAMDGYNDDLCVLENTWVRTQSGYKMIKDIEVGEYVLTHKNRFRRVTTKFISEKNEYKVISTIGKLDLGITGNHPLFVFDKIQGDWKDYELMKTWNKISEPYFNCLDKIGGDNIKNKYLASIIPNQEIVDMPKIDLWEFATGNYCLNGDDEIVSLLISNDNVQINPKSNIISRYIDLDNDFCFILGYFLAEGSKTKHGISFASHQKEYKIRNYIKSILQKYGFNPTEYYSKNSLGCILSIQSEILKQFFTEFKKSTTKQLPQKFLNLPINKLIYILCGYLAGDGCFYRSSVKSVTISPYIAFQMYEIATKCGIVTTIKGLTDSKAVTKMCDFGAGDKCYIIQPIIRLGFNLIKHDAIDLLYKLRDIGNTPKIKGERIKLHNNFVLGEISSVKAIKTEQNIKLYNLEVEEDNSYTANGIIVHNCMALGIGLWVRDTALRLKSESQQYSRAMVNQIGKAEYTGSAPIFSNKHNQSAYDSWNMRIGKGNERENLTWLLN